MKLDRVGRRIKMRQLEILSAVAECGTMGKASQRLAISQPVVSKAIADLERTLGVRLLDRRPEGTEPTPYGRALLKRSVVIFDELKQGLGEIEFLADPTAGELRIGCANSMLGGLVPVVINKLCDRHPRLTFHVSQAPSGAPLYRELRERHVDLVLGKLPMPPTEPDLVHEILFNEQQFVVAGAKNPLARRRSVTLAELTNARWALPAAEITGTPQVAQIFRACGLEIPNGTVFSNSMHLFNALVANGQFVTMFPTSLLCFGPKQSSLKVLPVKLPDIPWPIGITTLKDRTISPVARLFIDCALQISKPLATAGSRDLKFASAI